VHAQRAFGLRARCAAASSYEPPEGRPPPTAIAVARDVSEPRWYRPRPRRCERGTRPVSAPTSLVADGCRREPVALRTVALRTVQSNAIDVHRISPFGTSMPAKQPSSQRGTPRNPLIRAHSRSRFAYGLRKDYRVQAKSRR
jgi:hypothetical protein